MGQQQFGGRDEPIVIPRGGLQQWIADQTAGTGPRLLDDWLNKARLVRRLDPGQPWPAWSSGEVLAVAVIIDDRDRLAAAGYTADEALERLRFDIGEDTVESARTVFADLRAQLDTGKPASS